MAKGHVLLTLALMLLVAASAVVVVVFADDGFNDPAVVTLTGENFAAELESKEMVFVEFYAPWCGHCKNLAPEYQKVAEHFNKEGSDVSIAKVDATKESELASKYGVEGFPTLLLFKKGSETGKAYAGDRSSQAIISWIERQRGSAVTVVTSSEQANHLLQGTKMFVLGFFSEEEEAATFLKVAEKHRDKIKFAVAYGAEWIKEYDEASEPTVFLLRDFDEPRLEYLGDLHSEEELSNWFKAKSVPMLGELTFENASEYLARNLPFCLLFLDTKNKEVSTAIINTLKPVAAEYRDKLSFVYLDNSKFGSHQERLGLKGAVPALAIDDFTKNMHYPYSKAVGQDDVKDWVQSWVDGKLEPHLRSEAPPVDNSGPVKVVVGTTFESIVMDPTKDVLVEFYAPWCGHCKSLAPIYEKVGQKLAGIDSVVVAKMDATANDPPQSVHIEGFPTILFFPANNKSKPVTYDGKRKVKSFVKFIQQHASVSFELSEKKEEETSSSSSHEEL